MLQKRQNVSQEWTIFTNDGSVPMLIRREMENYALLEIQKLTGQNLSDPAEIKVIETTLHEEWYKELEGRTDNEFEYMKNKKDGNAMDLSFYDSDRYLWTTWSCWQDWSEDNFHKLIQVIKQINYKPKRIVDFGAGIGLGTIMMAMAFPEAEVYYCNVSPLQETIFKNVAKKYKLKNLKIQGDHRKIKDPDVYVCFEVFEHFYEPEDIIESIVSRPSVNIIARCDSYSRPGIGHFNEYKIRKPIPVKNPLNGEEMLDENGEKTFTNIVSGKFIQKRLLYLYRKNGFDKINKYFPIKIWNTRPDIFIKPSSF